MSTVNIKNVDKCFGTKQVLHHIDLKIDDGEFMVLVGPSGCGKSTILRIIAGLESATQGIVEIGETDVTQHPPRNRDIAMVFQDYALYPHMNVRDNMAFGLKLRKYSPTEIDTRVEEAAKILGLVEYLDRKPKALSGGQRQRVALGRAIVRKPKVFLFDEPLSNLDAKLRNQMRSEIKQLHQRLKTTIIYVTHDQVEAMTMGDKIPILKDGFLQQYDSPNKIYHHPINQFVAGFVGSPPMNFIAGTIKDNIFSCKQCSFKIPQYKQNISGDVILGIRPDDLYDQWFATDKPCSKIRAKVKMIEPLGSQTIVFLEIDDLEITATFPGNSLPEVGSIVEVIFDINAVHFFDKATGNAL